MRILRYQTLLKASTRIPYKVGVAILAWMWRQRWIQRKFLARQFQDFKRLTASISGELPDERLAFARYLACNYFASWRIGALARCSEQELEKWITVDGLNRIEELKKQGRGVVLLNSHYGSGKIPLLYLGRLGYTVYSVDKEDIFTVLGIRDALNIHSICLDDSKKEFFLRHVFQAKRVLQNGGILHLGGDGFRGQSGRPIAFHDRVRPFPSSFAELALATGAAIVPMFGTVDSSGHIRIEFLTPLELGENRSAASDKVHELVEIYAGLLEQRWCSDPSSIHKREITNHFSLPRNNLTIKRFWNSGKHSEELCA